MYVVPFSVGIHRLSSFSGPSQLQGPFDSNGFPVGCMSACSANLDGDPSIYLSYRMRTCSDGTWHLQQTHQTAVRAVLIRLLLVLRPEFSSIAFSVSQVPARVESYHNEAHKQITIFILDRGQLSRCICLRL